MKDLRTSTASFGERERDFLESVHFKEIDDMNNRMSVLRKEKQEEHLSIQKERDDAFAKLQKIEQELKKSRQEMRTS